MWSSSDTRVVSVSPSGEARAIASGTATIVGEAGGIRSQSVVSVKATAPASRSWSIEREGITDASMLGVWADATSPLAIVAGQAGIILESTGAGWQLLQMPTEESFTGVWGSSATNVFAVHVGSSPRTGETSRLAGGWRGSGAQRRRWDPR